MYRYYLLYNRYLADEKTKIGQLGHLLAYNIGVADAQLDLTVFYEDCEPDHLKLPARAGKSNESNWESWKMVKPGKNFSYMVESPEPLACQVTIGQNNTANSYLFSPGLRQDYREAVLAYAAIDRLANNWYHADGIVINQPDKIWVRESEWLIVLNPYEAQVGIEIQMHHREGTKVHKTILEPKRSRYIYMDEIVTQNSNYAAHVVSDRPIAAQWLRTVNWFDRAEMMSYWSLPLIPGL